MRQTTQVRSVVAGVALGVTLVAGCAANGDRFGLVEDTGARSRPDAGAGTNDADLSDTFGPAIADAGTPDTGTNGFENTDVACADFQDDDMNGVVDCADTTNCGSRAICCVGSTHGRCCAPPMALTPVIALDACAGPLASCVNGMASFGTPMPTIASTRDDGGSCGATGASIAPQGSDRSDGGVVATASVDTSAGAVALEATLGVSATAASSLDAIGVGLTTQGDLAATTLAHVQPSVAVLVSATDQTIRAIAGDVAFPARSLGPILPAGCSELEVRIVTSPAGTFDAFYRAPHATSWTTLETARPYEPTPVAHAVAYGRSTNPGVSGVHAWVRALSMASTTCDVLDPTRSTTGAFATLPLAGHAVRSVSRAGSLAVYEMDGSIYVAGVDGTGHLQALGRSGAAGDRILAPGEAPFMMNGLADPELVAIGDNRRLFFTGIDAMGTRSIGYLDFDTNVALRVMGSMPRQILSPDTVHVLGVDGPAYHEAVDDGGVMRRWLVFRAIVDASHSELRAMRLAGSSAVLGALETADVTAPPAEFFTTTSPTSPDVALYANRALVASAFDQDEIAAPEIVAYHGVVRVFFAARHGARWSIGMLRSPDFAHFELAYADPVLAGSGVGFDAVSVTDPDVTVDASGKLTLYYTATDGTATQPGLATQEVPTP